MWNLENVKLCKFKFPDTGHSFSCPGSAGHLQNPAGGLRVWRSGVGAGSASWLRARGSAASAPARLSLAACACARVSARASLALVVRLQWVQASAALEQRPADSVPHVSCLLSPCSEAPRLLVWVFLTLSVVPLLVTSVHPAWVIPRTTVLTFPGHLLLPGPGQSVLHSFLLNPHSHTRRGRCDPCLTQEGLWTEAGYTGGSLEVVKQAGRGLCHSAFLVRQGLCLSQGEGLMTLYWEP